LPFNKSSETTFKEKGDDEDNVCISFVPNFSGT
jgi:hypothetical protein